MRKLRSDGTISEQALPGANHDGKSPKPELIDEVVSKERLDQLPTAMNL